VAISRKSDVIGASSCIYFCCVGFLRKIGSYVAIVCQNDRLRRYDDVGGCLGLKSDICSTHYSVSLVEAIVLASTCFSWTFMMNETVS
jgi:hypothetical protein